MADSIEDFSSACSQVETYSGEVCRAELTSLQMCFTGMASPPLNVPSQIDQQTNEITAMLLMDALSQFGPSDECRDTILPFLCLGLFPFCDFNSNLHFVVREDCIALRDNICVEVWRAAMFLGPGIFPICEELADASNECIGKSTLSNY